MQERLVTMLVQVICFTCSKENLKDLADVILDFVEDKIAASENKIDDKLVLPICRSIRETFDIEDLDDIC